MLIQGEADQRNGAGGKLSVTSGAGVAPVADGSRVRADQTGESLLGEVAGFEGGAKLTRGSRPVGRIQHRSSSEGKSEDETEGDESGCCGPGAEYPDRSGDEGKFRELRNLRFQSQQIDTIDKHLLDKKGGIIPPFLFI